MKKLFLMLVALIVASVGLQAQQIAVVSKSGTTSIYKTLPEAVAGATAGSTVYLPGGGFTLTDTLKINKKLTIIGVGYYIAGGNVDGVTTIKGKPLSFINGSSGSALMGVYIPSDYVYIGKDGSAVEDILIRYCWLYYVQIWSNLCTGCVISKNYCSSIYLGQSSSQYGKSNAKVINNVCSSITCGEAAEIKYNIILNNINNTSSSNISYNVIVGTSSYNNSSYSNYSNQYYGNLSNMSTSYIGEGNTQLNASSWNDVFVKYNSSPNPTYDYHFKEAYQQYEGVAGIYAGNGFNDSGLPPVPYVTYKYIPDHTDANGKLNVKFRVKASE